MNFSTGEGFWCGHELRVLAIVKLGKWILYVVHIRQSLHPVITGKSTDAQGITRAYQHGGCPRDSRAVAAAGSQQ